MVYVTRWLEFAEIHQRVELPSIGFEDRYWNDL